MHGAGVGLVRGAGTGLEGGLQTGIKGGLGEGIGLEGGLVYCRMKAINSAVFNLE